ncbi:hypothetical protein [Borrelia sp. RT1S]|uniref:hypothetical protein n=1 Tax=Borrelia sp. RT1S TaxID=2898580 RepID=UPI001E39C69C|nr:hypothetical protein [Borrelia sp. RT1S]UGQ18017.1 hypothetical protein LSO05_06170 [Borrelia sp. RT1S]
MNKISMCILILMSIFVMSCEFWGGFGARKAKGDAEANVDVGRVDFAGGVKLLGNNAREEVSGGINPLDNAGAELAGGVNPVGGNADGGNNPVNGGMIGDHAGGKVAVVENLNTKLTEEDMGKLKDFIKNTKTYPGDLSYTISNAYAVPYGKIGTYSNCSDYRSSCFTNGPSEERSKGLEKLVDNKFEEKFGKLADMLKDANGYDPKDLTKAIAKYEEVLKEAQDANGKIEVKEDSFNFRGASDEARSRNMEYLRKVSATEEATLDAMRQASLDYANAFAHSVAGVSSNQFKEAVKEFTEAAREYAGVAKDARFTIITEVISVMVNDKNLNSQKSYAEYGPGGKEFVPAIEKLESAYKAVRPDPVPNVKK